MTKKQRLTTIKSNPLTLSQGNSQSVPASARSPRARHLAYQSLSTAVPVNSETANISLGLSQGDQNLPACAYREWCAPYGIRRLRESIRTTGIPNDFARIAPCATSVPRLYDKTTTPASLGQDKARQQLVHSYDCTGHIALNHWFKMLLQPCAKADRKIADIRRPFGKHRIWHFGESAEARSSKCPLNRMLGPPPRIVDKLHNRTKNVRILKHQCMDTEISASVDSPSVSNLRFSFLSLGSTRGYGDVSDSLPERCR